MFPPPSSPISGGMNSVSLVWAMSLNRSKRALPIYVAPMSYRYDEDRIFLYAKEDAIDAYSKPIRAAQRTMERCDINRKRISSKPIDVDLKLSLDALRQFVELPPCRRLPNDFWHGYYLARLCPRGSIMGIWVVVTP